ncbi:MAG: DUF2207 domain-containing protein [Pseudomonadota bacterium]
MRMMLLLLLLLLLSSLAQADERILSFHSDIVVNADASIEVTETIRVRAEGKQIRRGIYRDMPTEYFDKFGNRHEVSIEPLSVMRNGSPEDFHVRQPRDSIRVYFGDSNRFIDNGVHEYRYRYRAVRMLGFFENHDELYWNVSGFRWRFPIDEASATVRFTFDVDTPSVTAEAYTGAFGETGRDYTTGTEDGPVIHFRSNAPLSATNGLTIVAGWPKGLVAEPDDLQRAGWLLKDNRNVLLALSGLVILLGYYLPVWARFGKDPVEGVIVTRYEPPHGYSPASLRYIRQMYYDGKVMTAAIVNLAVKGYLSIHQNGEHRSLQREDAGPNPPPLAAGEQELYDALFKDASTIELDNKNHKVLGEARSAHQASLVADYKDKYFSNNAMLHLPAVFIAIVFTVIPFTVSQEPTALMFVFIIAMFLAILLFAFIMRRPTIRGRKLLDQMMGFRDYLDVAEKDELNLRNPPRKTPQLFERMLPYALALGVDQKWGERFASTLAGIRDAGGQPYHPAWYHGSWNSSTNMASDLSSGFNTALAQSVAPPGSSSGGGGGGFSGGGGGGGGGGGW